MEDYVAQAMALAAMAKAKGGGTTDAYTKSETDALLDTKADKSTTYTKAEIDSMIGNINTVLEEVL